MHCPSCGSHASEQQKFCRACGMNLDDLAERVAAHQGTASAAKRKFDSLLSGIGLWMALGGGGAFVLMMLLALVSEAFDLLSKGTINFIGEKVAVIALSSLFLGIGLLALPHLLPLVWKPKRNRSPQSVTTVELAEPPLLTNVSSVTEHTTRNLELILEERTKPSVSSELTHHT